MCLNEKEKDLGEQIILGFRPFKRKHLSVLPKKKKVLNKSGCEQLCLCLFYLFAVRAYVGIQIRYLFVHLLQHPNVSNFLVGIEAL